MTTTDTSFDPAHAARILAASRQSNGHIDELPAQHRPGSRAEGYAVQTLWPALFGQSVAGWKIAATSAAGQAHIRVDGPLAGPVLSGGMHQSGGTVSLQGNRMRVAECEMVFRFGTPLPARSQTYTRSEVLAAVDAVLPGIEVPDSRFIQFERAGVAQLIADCACSRDMVMGTPLALDDRVHALAQLRVRASMSDGRVAEGIGSNVMSDPVEALVWVVNELSAAGQALQAGQFVTTGACVVPIPVTPGVQVAVDFGWLGRIQARFS